MLEVSDGELSSTVDGTLSCTNSPPEVSDVTIVPAGTGQELECTYTYTDVESDPDQSITTWYVNGVMESMGSTLPTHGPGDSIRCEVTPFDGEEMGTTQEATFDATPAPPLEMLTSGASHTCTIIAGRAMCWGGNSAGQVGVGHNNLTSPPATPQGLSSGVTAISAGNQHTCAIQNGGLFCWGANNRGQLGTGDRTDASTPQPVMNMSSGVTAVAAGNLHTCAIKNDELYCWGTNGFGELGQGVAGDSMNLPRLVSPGIFTQPVERISAGAHHNCAVQGPQLYCWGSNDGGQIGIDPVTTFSGTPQAIAMFGNGISLLDTGSHFTCASSTGSLYCWGLNDHGQLGDGSLISTFTPTQVSGLSADVTALTTGAGSACAVHQNRLKCWGQNRTGQLGNGTMIGSPLPAGVTGLPMGPDAITISSEHACASIQDTLYCWGENGQSQLGDTMPSSTSPRQISIQ